MAFDVFISYSSKDKPAADAACAVLESRGLRCWLAPRDILPGADWSQSIIDALNDCRVMVLIFSGNANASPQVKREVERAVNRGRTIIPVRIEEVLPAKALEYFLSTPHWLDAFTPPLEQHLERLAATIQQLLAQPGAEVPPPPPPPPARKVWRRYIVPTAVTAAACAALALLAVIAFRDSPGKTPGPGGPSALDGLARADGTGAQQKKPNGPKSAAPAERGVARLIGRWQGDIPDDDGKKRTGLMDLKDTGSGAELGMLAVAFSETFALPYGGENGVLYFSTDKQVDFGAGTVPLTEQDAGSFHLTAGRGVLAGMCRLEDEDKTLVMRVKGGVEFRWTRVTADGPLLMPAALLPEPAEWPVKDVNGLTRRATEYARRRWHPDAKPVSVELECEYSFGAIAELKAAVLFRSASTGQGLQLNATSAGVQLAETENGRDFPPLPATFPELTEVLAQQDVPPRQLKSAELKYRFYYDNRKYPNQYMPPCPYPQDGFYWQLPTEKVWHYVPVPGDNE